MKLIHILATALLFSFTAYSVSASSGDFEIIKERVTAELMKSTVDDQKVTEIISRMKEDGSFEGINYEDLSRTAGFPQRNHTGYLVDLALAYKKKSSAFYRDNKLKKIIINGLQYWAENDFFGDNWHNNQISTPTNLVNFMLIIGEEMPGELVELAQPIIGRANLNASGARPSGDRIVIAGILAKNLLFTENKEEFNEVIKVIEGEIKFSTGERGMQHDYSFHHRTDRVNNTTSYGYGKYANAFGEWAYYVSGTGYAFSTDKINQLVDYYLDGICKQQVYGIYEDISVKNRSITSKATFKPQGTTELERLMLNTDYRKDELEEIIRLRKGETRPKNSFAKFFWQTEHFVFQRPHFYTTVRMFSTRNRNMEEPYNGPGKPTHHRADGTNYLMQKGDEYHNIWPVYDWQKISGTTILQKPQLHGPEEIQKDGLTEFVGAVTDELYGAVVFDFRSPHDMTQAKKSWFFFDDEYVCLGSGIGSNSNLSVATTINQTLMRGDVTVMADGSVSKLQAGNHKLENVKWVFHDGVGYILPESAAINISNQKEEGRWSDITDQKNISKEIVTEDVFALWFDHGKRPVNGSYQYIVVPGIKFQDINEEGTNNRNIEILSNTAEMQAVKHHKLGLIQCTFYKAGELEINKGMTIGIDSQGMAMIKMKEKQIKEVTLSDPSRKLFRMLIFLPGLYNVKGEGYVSWQDAGNNRTFFVVDMPKGVYSGKSITIHL